MERYFSREMTVELFTSSGWNHTTPIDDALFSTFLEPYRELGEEMPKRIEITGSVAEIIEEEWDAYLILVELMKECEKTKPEGEGEIDKNYSDTTPFMVDVVTGVHREDSCSLPVPGLHSLSRLSRVLNFPEGWAKYVYVDERTPQLERFTHLLAQGMWITATRKRSITTYLSIVNITVGQYDFSFFSLFLTFFYLFKRSERIHKGEVLKREGTWLSNFFCGLARNLVLRGCNRSNVMWNDVLWQDIVPLCNRELSQPIECDECVAATIDALMGISIHDSSNIQSISLFSKLNRTDLDVFNHNEGLPILYHRVLSAFPDNVNPREIGLGKMIDDDHTEIVVTRDTIKLHEVVAWVHSVVISAYYNRMKKRRSKTTQPHHNIIVRLMAFTFIGREGLRRILLSLLHSFNDEPGESNANIFAAVIERYLYEEESSEEGKCKLGNGLIDLLCK